MSNLHTLQVVFGGDPEAALIQYTKNEEARRAISSTEAVLNNRFIRVHWHREPGTNAAGLQQQEQNSGGQAAGSAPIPAPQHSNMLMVNIFLSCFFFFPPLCSDTIYPTDFSFFFYQQGIKQHSPAAYVLNKTVPKHRLPLAAGTMSTTKLDSLNPNTEAVTVCFSLSFQVWLCEK